MCTVRNIRVNTVSPHARDVSEIPPGTNARDYHKLFAEYCFCSVYNPTVVAVMLKGYFNLYIVILNYSCLLCCNDDAR